MARKMLGEILLEDNCIDEATLKKALEKQRQYALTDSTNTDRLPIPYVVQPDWKIALFFKLGVLPILMVLLAKMSGSSGLNVEAFPTLLALLVGFLFIDLLVIRHTYVQKVVLYEDKLIYKGKTTIKYSDITKIESGMYFSFTQIGYRAKIYVKGSEEPILINISMFDNTDLKVMYTILNKRTDAELDEFSDKILNGKVKMVESDFIKWMSLIIGVLLLVFLLVGLMNVVFK